MKINLPLVMETNKKLVKKTLIYLALIFITCLVFFPIAWMVSVSIRPHAETFVFPPTWIPKHLTLSSYNKIFLNPKNTRVFLNSYVIAGGVTILSVVLASCAGYGFSRFKFPGNRFFLAYTLMSQMIPGSLIVIPYFLIMLGIGLYNTYWALIITDSSTVLPFCILLFRNYFDTIPVEVEEAAMIDGCSRLRAFYNIILPLSGPALLSTGIFAFLLGWNEFMFALTLTETKDMRTVTVTIGGLIGQFTSQWNLMMAFSVVANFPLIIFFAFFQKYLMRSTIGGTLK